MSRRGQLVLVAAGVIAVALVPMLAAYLQLGYGGDVGTSARSTAPTGDAIRALEGAVSDVSSDIQAEYDWRDRADAAGALRSQLAPRIRTVENAMVTDGVARSVTYNASLATRVADEACPGGPSRQFGSCVADGGVVLQDRLGDTHIVAVAIDVGSTGERGHTRVATVLEVP